MVDREVCALASACVTAGEDAGGAIVTSGLRLLGNVTAGLRGGGRGNMHADVVWDERASEMRQAASPALKPSHQKAKACERPSIPHPHLLLAGCSPMYCRPHAPVRSRPELSPKLHMLTSATQRVSHRASRRSAHSPTATCC